MSAGTTVVALIHRGSAVVGHAPSAHFGRTGDFTDAPPPGRSLDSVGAGPATTAGIDRGQDRERP